MVWGTLVAALLASCVDTEIADVTVTKPESIAQYEYLNDYAPLKSYIDRAANPDFKLGLGVGSQRIYRRGIGISFSGSQLRRSDRRQCDEICFVCER